MGSNGNITKKKPEYQDFESFGGDGESQGIQKFNLIF